MTRVFLTVVLPLLLPTALYILWALVTDRAAFSSAAWQRVPWIWLLLAGLVAAAVALVFFVEAGSDGDGRYVPPHVEHGTIVPGHVDPEPAAR